MTYFMVLYHSPGVTEKITKSSNKVSRDSNRVTSGCEFR
jgi:hypothetical protein